jgi:uncharacterized protein
MSSGSSDWEAYLFRALGARWHAVAHDPRPDVAHDVGHIRRVLRVAREIAAAEGPHDALALTAAAILHDVVALPKNHPERHLASRMSAAEARRILEDAWTDPATTDITAHAIEAHSFSAGVDPRKPEARALQDADRIDALGAIGIARCFAVSGEFGRPLFDPEDLLARRRPVIGCYALDHFEAKLLRLPGTMRTRRGREIAEERAAYLRDLRERLTAEAGGGAGGRGRV